MISVEWQQDADCDNCKQFAPHCAEIDFNFDPDNPESFTEHLFNATLCSNCVADLIKRLQ